LKVTFPLCAEISDTDKIWVISGIITFVTAVVTGFTRAAVITEKMMISRFALVLAWIRQFTKPSRKETAAADLNRIIGLKTRVLEI
jgi:lysylphosphatidylglycerol synthetase-like protein (DUF2156 family)